MGNSDILALAFELKEKILNSDLYKDLKAKEEKMFEDKACSLLLSEFEKVKEEYKEVKRFEKYGGNVEVVQKKLSEIKYRVDENELVKEYNMAYKAMRAKMKQLEKIILKDIIKEKKEIVIEE